jgi:hypothetical protein
MASFDFCSWFNKCNEVLHKGPNANDPIPSFKQVMSVAFQH